MDNTQLLDGNGDGLPDHDTRANTYDAWAMQGRPLISKKPVAGSVKAAVHGPGSRVDRAAAWEALLEKGSKAFVESSGTADISVSGRTATSGTTAARRTR